MMESNFGSAVSGRTVVTSEQAVDFDGFNATIPKNDPEG